MSIRPAAEMRLFIAEGEAWLEFDGLRLRSLSLGARPVDASDLEAPDGWRALLPATDRSARIAASGLATGGAAETALRNAFFNAALATCRLQLPGAGRIEGAFAVEQLDFDARQDGEAGLALVLLSAGALVFTPEEEG